MKWRERIKGFSKWLLLGLFGAGFAYFLYTLLSKDMGNQGNQFADAFVPIFPILGIVILVLTLPIAISYLFGKPISR